MASVATLKDLVDALIQSATEEKKLEEVTSNLESFFKLYSTEEDIKSSVGSSVFELDERKNIIMDICKQAGFSAFTANFLTLAIDLDKFKSLINNEEQVISKLKHASGVIKAEITAATNISDLDLQRVKDVLGKATGKQVEISVNIDPSVIGGIITRVEDKVFDNSVKTQLERIKGVLTPS